MLPVLHFSNLISQCPVQHKLLVSFLSLCCCCWGLESTLSWDSSFESSEIGLCCAPASPEVFQTFLLKWLSQMLVAVVRISKGKSFWIGLWRIQSPETCNTAGDELMICPSLQRPQGLSSCITTTFPTEGGVTSVLPHINDENFTAQWGIWTAIFAKICWV